MVLFLVCEYCIFIDCGKVVSFESCLSKIGRFLDAGSERCRILYVSLLAKKGTNKSQSNAISQYYILFFDSFVAFLSIFVSIHLRIGMDFLDYSPIYIIKNMFVFGLVGASVFLWFQIYQSFWKYTSVEDVIPVFLSVITSNVLFFPLMMLMNQEDFLPYSVLIINVCILSFMLLIPRFTTKILYNNKMNKIKKMNMFGQNEKQADYPDVLLVGNPASVDIFMNEIVIDDEFQSNFNPVGILSIDQEDVGRAIKGISIIGNVKQTDSVFRGLAKVGVFPKQILIVERSIPENMKKFLASYGKTRGILLMHVLHQYTFNTVTE